MIKTPKAGCFFIFFLLQCQSCMSAKEKQLFVIIDGNAIIHRAYHAIPPLTVKSGTVVNAVFGFSSMLLKVLNDLKPTHIAVSFDVAGGTFRDDIYDKYKATRVKADQELYDQIPLVHDVVEAFNIPVYEKEGYEADDVIGTIVNEPDVQRSKTEVVIVTGDKDLLQLVDGTRVQVALLTKGMSEYTLFDEKMVKEKYGFGPELIPDYKALMGDPSDNIPGVSGIGKKTAGDLIQSIGSVKDIYKQTDNIKAISGEYIKQAVIKKLEEGKENAMMSLELARIITDVKGLHFNIKKCEAYDFDKEKVKKLFQTYEFFSLIKRIPGMEETHGSGQKKKAQGKEKQPIEIDAETIPELLKHLHAHQAFAAKEIVAGVLPGGRLDGFFIAANNNIYRVLKARVSAKEWASILSVFAVKNKRLVGHDLKQLVKTMMNEGFPVENQLFDVMVASYIINSSTRDHSLRSIVIRELGVDVGGTEAEQGSLFAEPAQGAPPGFCDEISLYEHFEQALKKEKQDALFADMEMPLIPVLARMELWGIEVDGELMAELSKEVEKSIGGLEKKIQKEAGISFNVASSSQLRDVLFDTLGLPTDGIKKGKTGYSTSASELEKLHGIHPIIAYIEEHRELAKLQNTYIDVLPGLIHKKTGRIHTSFNQAVATTGRLSSSDPNLQNIPIRTQMGRRIRDAFVAQHGFTLLSADYSQIELRVVASLAKDKRLMEIFEKGEDVHAATAAAINHVSLKDVTREMRQAAKAVNFGVLYGMGAYGLSWRTHIPQWQAKEFIDAYFESFSGVKAYLDETLKKAKHDGYVETIFGRRRYIPELHSGNFQLKNAGERMAINMPIQGTAAEIMKLAMIEVDEAIENGEIGKQKGDVRMLLQVHDELVLEVKSGQEETVAKQVKESMEHIVELAVPVEVHINTAHRWGQVK